jgi:ankyrin repeat protein
MHNRTGAFYRNELQNEGFRTMQRTHPANTPPLASPYSPVRNGLGIAPCCAILLATWIAISAAGCRESPETPPPSQAPAQSDNDALVEAAQEDASTEDTSPRSFDHLDLDAMAIYDLAKLGDAELVRARIEAGDDPNHQDRNGFVALHHASLLGHVEVVQTLLAMGAEVDVEGAGLWRPLHWAAGEGNQPEIVTLLIAAGANLDNGDTNGYTPLHHAARHGHVEVGRILIEAGANVNSRGNNGTTPLHWAQREGRDQFAALLIEHGGEE